ncbi:MAG: hypothetical protein NC218_08435 [Acetobacter sp.]|nr:hypothetical protein [Acetobacter sp.]
MANYAVLDYDGFICKSWYASFARGDMDDAVNVLNDLVDASIEKALNYYDGRLDGIIKIVSGHSWKKDLYETYKATREKNPYIGAYREALLDVDKDIIKPQTLEADELCIMLQDYLFDNGGSCIVFSDDKDLHYTSLIHCKINITEQIDFFYDERYVLYQMLAGDREDNITGLNKVGMKTAEKLMKDRPSAIDEVFKIYKDKKVSKEECIKNINLIIPMMYNFNENKSSFKKVCNTLLKENKVDEYAVKNCTQGQLDFLNRKADEIYDK